MGFRRILTPRIIKIRVLAVDHIVLNCVCGWLQHCSNTDTARLAASDHNIKKHGNKYMILK